LSERESTWRSGLRLIFNMSSYSIAACGPSTIASHGQLSLHELDKCQSSSAVLSRNPTKIASILEMAVILDKVKRGGDDSEIPKKTCLRAGRMHAEPSGLRCHVRDQEHGTQCRSTDGDPVLPGYFRRCARHGSSARWLHSR
jgi:hypothetical protein